MSEKTEIIGCAICGEIHGSDHNSYAGKEKEWTRELLQRKLYDFERLYKETVERPSPEHLDLLIRYAKEYANVWCQDKAE